MSEEKKNFNKWQALSLAWELGYIIALPLVLFGFLGRYFDEKYNTHPYLKIVGILLAIAITAIWITRRFSALLKSALNDQSAGTKKRQDQKSDKDQHTPLPEKNDNTENKS